MSEYQWQAGKPIKIYKEFEWVAGNPWIVFTDLVFVPGILYKERLLDAHLEEKLNIKAILKKTLKEEYK